MIRVIDKTNARLRAAETDLARIADQLAALPSE